MWECVCGCVRGSGFWCGYLLIKNLSRAKKIKSVIKKTKSSDQKFVVIKKSASKKSKS